MLYTLISVFHPPEPNGLPWFDFSSPAKPFGSTFARRKIMPAGRGFGKEGVDFIGRTALRSCPAHVFVTRQYFKKGGNEMFMFIPKPKKTVRNIGIVATLGLLIAAIGYSVALCAEVPAIRPVLGLSCAVAVIGSMLGGLAIWLQPDFGIGLFRVLLGIGSLCGAVSSLRLVVSSGLGSDTFGMMLAGYISLPVLAIILRASRRPSLIGPAFEALLEAHHVD